MTDKTKGKKKIVAIIQARMGSERLPGKVMMPICGKAILEWVVLRVGKSKLVDQLAVATSRKVIDTPIVKLCDKLGIECFRGSERNVLQRFYLAARKLGADIIVRITADCPFIDPKIIDKMIKIHLKNDNDYTATASGDSYPRGLDVEVFNWKTLKTAYEKAIAPGHKEHVTSFIYDRLGEFKIEIVPAPKGAERPDYRLCVDEREDLALARKVYKQFAPLGDFTFKEVIEFLDENPKITGINKNVKQKAI